MVKLEKLSDRELALRMSKYIADLESIKLRPFVHIIFLTSFKSVIS